MAANKPTKLSGVRIEYNRHCQHEFGEFVQTREPHDNDMQPCTSGALDMRPTGDAQGSYYYFSLLTGQLEKRMALEPGTRAYAA